MTNGDDVKGDQPGEYMVLAPDLLQQHKIDEISLYDLWAVLVKKRILILAVLAAAIAASVAVAFMMPPVYQAVIFFAEPLNKDVDPLNITEFSSGHTPASVYETFLRNFEIRDNLWKFYTKKQLYKAYLGEKEAEDKEINRAFAESFSKDLALIQPNEKERIQSFFKATLDWNSDIEAAALLNEYSQQVMQMTVKQIVDELQAKLAKEKKDLEVKIALLRRATERSTNYRLAMLDENIQIARELGLNRPKTLEEQKSFDVYVTLSENNPLYFQGYELLEAEKQALLSRKDQDPFISGLLALQDRLDYLNTIKIPADNIRVIQILLEAKALGEPVKPKKKQIVVVGFFLGLLLGMFAALISNYRGKVREHASSS